LVEKVRIFSTVVREMMNSTVKMVMIPSIVEKVRIFSMDSVVMTSSQATLAMIN